MTKHFCHLSPSFGSICVPLLTKMRQIWLKLLVFHNLNSVYKQESDRNVRTPQLGTMTKLYSKLMVLFNKSYSNTVAGKEKHADGGERAGHP